MIERVRANQTGIQNRRFKKAHVFEAIQDPQVWLYILIQIMYVGFYSGFLFISSIADYVDTSIQIPTGGLGSFSTILIKNFGFTELQTELLSMVNGGFQCFVLLASAWLSRRFNQTVIFQLVMLSTISSLLCQVLMNIDLPPTKHSRNRSSNGQVLYSFSYIAMCDKLTVISCPNLPLDTHRSSDRILVHPLFLGHNHSFDVTAIP